MKKVLPLGWILAFCVVKLLNNHKGSSPLQYCSTEVLGRGCVYASHHLFKWYYWVLKMLIILPSSYQGGIFCSSLFLAFPVPDQGKEVLYLNVHSLIFVWVLYFGELLSLHSTRLLVWATRELLAWYRGSCKSFKGDSWTKHLFRIPCFGNSLIYASSIYSAQGWFSWKAVTRRLLQQSSSFSFCLHISVKHLEKTGGAQSLTE